MANVAKDGSYDLVIAGRESIDYNGGMVPGMVAGIIDANFVNNCINLEVEGNNATATRENRWWKRNRFHFTPVSNWRSKRIS